MRNQQGGPLVERLLVHGPQTIGDDQLLALALGGLDYESRVAQSRAFVAASQGRLLAQINSETVREVDRNTQIQLTALDALAKRTTDLAAAVQYPLIDTTAKIAGAFAFLRDQPNESFHLVCTNAGRRLTGIRKLFDGDPTTTVVAVRKVVEAALAHNAAHVAFIHNHPDGDPRPSPSDRRAMLGLYGIFGQMGIGVIDSVIVARTGYYSFRKDIVLPY